MFTVQCLIRQWSCRGSHGVFVCLYFCIFLYLFISAVQCCSVDDKAVGRRERWCVCSSTPDTRGQYEARALFFLPASKSCLYILFFLYLYRRYPEISNPSIPLTAPRSYSHLIWGFPLIDALGWGHS